MSREQAELELFFRVMTIESHIKRQEILENFYGRCQFPALRDRIAEEAENAYQKRVCGSSLLSLPSKLESVTQITVNHQRK